MGRREERIGYRLIKDHLLQGHDGKEKQKEEQRRKKWVLQFRDLPDVGRQRAVTSRFIADIPITSGDPTEFMKALDYSYVIRCLSLLSLGIVAEPVSNRHDKF